MMAEKQYKYAQPQYFTPEKRTWPSKKLTVSPIWCAVDLRDGNQALPVPLSPQKKLDYFNLLAGIGFKEIEIGFPAASLDDWTFCRNLIDRDIIPGDVTISVLTQARKHIIQRTMEALQGVKKGVCHIYIPTSELHDKFVLGEERSQIFKRVIDSVKFVRQYSLSMKGSSINLEFSPEEFTDSNLPFVVELCQEVVRAWEPASGEKVIINLPCTVERALPTHYPDMVEAFLELYQEKERSIISLHAHNDMGGAIASTELALLAGGERVEGTLFGNGERSGNLDLVTLALNLQYLGIETGLDFSKLEEISVAVAQLTSMPVNPRQPYAGKLVFTAFAGSHQDAIRKGLAHYRDLSKYFQGWKIPYLHINPHDIGRTFQGAIRINSQSGKGGVAYVLEQSYGIQVPEELLVELAAFVQHETDKTGKELSAESVWSVFLREFQCLEQPLKLLACKYTNASGKTIMDLSINIDGENKNLHSSGDGPVEAFANAVRVFVPDFKLLDYRQQSIGATVRANSFTIIKLENFNSKGFYGVCEDFDITQSAIKAFISALNRMIINKDIFFHE